MHNFEIRKHLLEYDDVMNQQREVIYKMRSNALRGENLRDVILDMIDQIVEDRVELHVGDQKYVEDWNWAGLNKDLQRFFLLSPMYHDGSEVPPGLTKELLIEQIKEKARANYALRERTIGKANMRKLERLVMLQQIDIEWRDHLYEMDQLKEGIGLRAYGQKDPLIEYKSEGFRAFTDMLARINEGVVELIFKAQIRDQSQFVPRRRPRVLSEVHDSSAGMGFRTAAATASAAGQQTLPQQPAPGKKVPVVVGPKVGRNDPCPCGSGKKYKKCHGR
ncbi:MAG: SEC-C metal-binding domain-containing protein [candidate division KSB1 bacterium]|nr:SEC-C metal-binding domain-containing protein [candidate division KSB1 bacterium]